MDFNLELANEVQLLLTCSTTEFDFHRQKRIELYLNKTLDWEYIIDLASLHRLMPILYWNLRNYPNSVPKETYSYLKDYFLKNTQKNLFFLAELFDILSILANEGITAIPFKGPILAISIYGNISLRDFDDLDIFINPQDVLKSRESLTSKGFRSVLSLDDVKEKKYFKSQHEYQFRNKDKNYLLELHWKFSELYFYFPNDELEVLDANNLSSTLIQNRDIKSFSPEDLLLILCIHSAGHKWSRLAWIDDVATLCNRYKNLKWKEVFNKAKTMGIKRILLITLCLSLRLFDVCIPSHLIDAINSDRNVRKISSQIISGIFSTSPNSTRMSDEFIMHLQVRDNISYGIVDVFKHVFKPTTQDWEKIDLPISLYFFYYILRPLRLLVSYKI